jgi:hypothetical protein
LREKRWSWGSKKLLFFSEESDPKALAVSKKISADRTRETGIKVIMESLDFLNEFSSILVLFPGPLFSPFPVLP